MDKEGVNIVVTPELSITGYTCADLFFQDTLLTKDNEEIRISNIKNIIIKGRI